MGFFSDSWEAMRDAEAQAGKEYWRAWQGIRIEFGKSDKKRIPTHWNRLPKRKSAIYPINENSTHPINTLFNYSYSQSSKPRPVWRYYASD
jgi:CRISPR/Cas system-associated endonuclease Cas1